MKHTKKWLKITASTLALTGAIATPIALTSCSENGPVDPIDPVSTYRMGVLNKLTNHPDENKTYITNTFDISFGGWFTSNAKIWFFLANKEDQDIMNDYVTKIEHQGQEHESLQLTCKLTIDDRKNIPDSNMQIRQDSQNVIGNWYLGSLTFSASNETDYNNIFKDKSIVVSYEVSNPNGNFADGTGTIQENLTINFK